MQHCTVVQYTDVGVAVVVCACQKLIDSVARPQIHAAGVRDTRSSRTCRDDNY